MDNVIEVDFTYYNCGDCDMPEDCCGDPHLCGRYPNEWLQQQEDEEARLAGLLAGILASLYLV